MFFVTEVSRELIYIPEIQSIGSKQPVKVPVFVKMKGILEMHVGKHYFKCKGTEVNSDFFSWEVACPQCTCFYDPPFHI